MLGIMFTPSRKEGEAQRKSYISVLTAKKI